MIALAALDTERKNKMKLTKQKLKEIIREELQKEWGVGSLPNLNLKPRRGPGWREGTPEEQAELERLHSAGSGEEDIIGELREMLQVWEIREYPSDRDRYMEYAEDVEALIKRHEMPLEEENKNEAE